MRTIFLKSTKQNKDNILEKSMTKYSPYIDVSLIVRATPRGDWPKGLAGRGDIYSQTCN